VCYSLQVSIGFVSVEAGLLNGLKARMNWLSKWLYCAGFDVVNLLGLLMKILVVESARELVL
jgi:hypothetical protein